MEPFDFNFMDYFSGTTPDTFDQWLQGQGTTTATKPWWELDQEGSVANLSDLQDTTPAGAYEPNVDWNSLGNADYFHAGQTASAPGTTPLDSGGSWLGNYGGKALNNVLSSKWTVPTALGLGGALLQGSADQSSSDLAKKLREAQAKGATNYMNALQTGRDEAKSSYLQNMAGQKASLLQKIGQSTADTGGANPRRAMEKFQRGANEGYGSFLLKLAQEKTPDLSAFTQQAIGDVPGEDWWTGFKRGGASTLGTITGTMAQANLLNSLLGKG